MKGSYIEITPMQFEKLREKGFNMTDEGNVVEGIGRVGYTANGHIYIDTTKITDVGSRALIEVRNEGNSQIPNDSSIIPTANHKDWASFKMAMRDKYNFKHKEFHSLWEEFINSPSTYKIMEEKFDELVATITEKNQETAPPKPNYLKPLTSTKFWYIATEYRLRVIGGKIYDRTENEVGMIENGYIYLENTFLSKIKK